MSKAILMPVSPNQCDHILNGKLTALQTGTHPTIKPPFKVYLYRTISRFGSVRLSDGKVFGEFTCEAVSKIGNHSWVLNIPSLTTYGNPKMLEDFKKYNRECFYEHLGYAIPNCSSCNRCCVSPPLTKWVYVEELKG